MAVACASQRAPADISEVADAWCLHSSGPSDLQPLSSPAECGFGAGRGFAGTSTGPSGRGLGLAAALRCKDLHGALVPSCRQRTSVHHAPTALPARKQ